MKFNIPDISKQIYKAEVLSVLQNKYSSIGPMWVSHQMEWSNSIYATFKDHDKFMIVIFLIKKTLDFYSRNFVRLSYEEFYSKDMVAIEQYSMIEISNSLNIPKESVRRKLQELEEIGVINKFKKKITIDRSKFYFSKPVNSIKRISRFLSMLSELLKDENILQKKITSEKLEIIIKNNFSYIWKLYYELQIPMMINYKKIFKDLETFHIFGTCIVNQHLFIRKISGNNIKRDIFIEDMSSAKMTQGINAMSISDITGIPRATVIRKLKILVKQKHLSIDEKKHYRLTGKFIKKLKPLQSDVLDKLADFSAKAYNLQIL